MTKDSDALLVAAIAAGDEEAARRFDERFRHRVQAIGRKRGILPADSEDVAQEVMVYALTQLRQGKFRGEAALSTWLHPIIHGKIVDHLRSRPNPAVLPSEGIATQRPTLVWENASDNALWVRQALAQLPAEERFVLRLHEVEGYTYEEIGRIIGLRKSAVDVRVKRAREHFRQIIRDAGNPPPPQRLTE